MMAITAFPTVLHVPRTEKITPRTAQEPVQTLYKPKSEADVLSDLQRMKAQKMSTRRIAEHYKNGITCADVSRALHGKFPKGNAKRQSFGIAPICPTCHNRPPKRRPDIAYTQSRRARLNAIARARGYASWCAYETDVLSDEREIP